LYKPNMTAAVAALLIATAPLAYAQTAPHVTTVAATSTLSGIIQPDQIRASQMIGSSVYSVQNGVSALLGHRYPGSWTKQERWPLFLCCHWLLLAVERA
jgi:hypothetical protein